MDFPRLRHSSRLGNEDETVTNSPIDTAEQEKLIQSYKNQIDSIDRTGRTAFGIIGFIISVLLLVCAYISISYRYNSPLYHHELLFGKYHFSVAWVFLLELFSSLSYAFCTAWMAASLYAQTRSTDALHALSSSSFPRSSSPAVSSSPVLSSSSCASSSSSSSLTSYNESELSYFSPLPSSSSSSLGSAASCSSLDSTPLPSSTSRSNDFNSSGFVKMVHKLSSFLTSTFFPQGWKSLLVSSTLSLFALVASSLSTLLWALTLLSASLSSSFHFFLLWLLSNFPFYLVCLFADSNTAGLSVELRKLSSYRYKYTTL
eukprot:TRINITY_DN4093_c0_g1_i1.p1 TRINITY_DN4093_c0_g1~~TRINITY_DN4093_c0_g1_i1.p1  ORF type:complete len:316 (-),score=64.56 TRINITY_DN4093_c0_g1_i1:96-1043(-)